MAAEAILPAFLYNNDKKADKEPINRVLKNLELDRKNSEADALHRGIKQFSSGGLAASSHAAAACPAPTLVPQVSSSPDSQDGPPCSCGDYFRDSSQAWCGKCGSRRPEDAVQEQQVHFEQSSEAHSKFISRGMNPKQAALFDLKDLGILASQSFDNRKLMLEKKVAELLLKICYVWFEDQEVVDCVWDALKLLCKSNDRSGNISKKRSQLYHGEVVSGNENKTDSPNRNREIVIQAIVQATHTIRGHGFQSNTPSAWYKLGLAAMHMLAADCQHNKDVLLAEGGGSQSGSNQPGSKSGLQSCMEVMKWGLNDYDIQDRCIRFITILCSDGYDQAKSRILKKPHDGAMQVLKAMNKHHGESKAGPTYKSAVMASGCRFFICLAENSKENRDAILNQKIVLWWDQDADRSDEKGSIELILKALGDLPEAQDMQVDGCAALNALDSADWPPKISGDMRGECPDDVLQDKEGKWQLKPQTTSGPWAIFMDRDKPPELAKPPRRMKASDAELIAGATVEAMCKHPEDERLQTQGRWVLLQLVCDSRERIINKLLCTMMQDGNLDNKEVQCQCFLTLAKLALVSRENREELVDAKGVEAISKSMQHHAGDATILEYGCDAFQQMMVMAYKCRDMMVSDGGVEAVLEGMKNRKFLAEADETLLCRMGNSSPSWSACPPEDSLKKGSAQQIAVAEETMHTLQMFCAAKIAGQEPGRSGRDKFVENGGVETFVEYMTELQMERKVQSRGFETLHAVALDCHENRERMQSCGGIEIILKIMLLLVNGRLQKYDAAEDLQHTAQHMKDVLVWGCNMLQAFASDSADNRVQIVNNEGLEVLLKSYIKYHINIAKYPDFPRDLDWMELEVGMQLLCLRTHSQLDDLFRRVALDENPISEEELTNLKSCAFFRRYTCLSLIKDTVMPVQDVVVDALQIVSFSALQCPYGLFLMVVAVCITSLTSCAYSMLRRAQNMNIAFLNLLTVGTMGACSEAFRCQTMRHKTQTLVVYKLIGGCESVISLAVLLYSLVVAGHSPDWPLLDAPTVSLRWWGIFSSLICLPTMAYDVAYQSILRSRDCKHLWDRLHTFTGQFELFAFHFFEVCGQFVFIPFAVVTTSEDGTPYGVYFLFVFKYLCVWRCTDGPSFADRSVRRLSMQAGIPSITFTLVSLILVFPWLVLNLTMDGERQDMEFGRSVASLRLMSWTAAWLIVGLTFLQEPSCVQPAEGLSTTVAPAAATTCINQLNDASTLLVFGIAVFGYLGYVVLWRRQWQWGRWLADLPEQAERLGSYRLMCVGERQPMLSDEVEAEEDLDSEP